MTATATPPQQDGRQAPQQKVVSGQPLARTVGEVLSTVDTAGLIPAALTTVVATTRAPRPVAGSLARYAGGVLSATATAAARAVGSSREGPLPFPAKDKRFRDPAFQGNPTFWWLVQQHQLLARLLDEVVEEVPVDATTRRKAEFVALQLQAALAPSNSPFANPAVLKHAFDTGGRSLVTGLKHGVGALLLRRGEPRQITEGAFCVGEDLAVTPGKVIFRNRLMEMIQYEPQTKQVHETPVLFSPPWINKYYMMDLAPKRSLIEWTVQQGHTVFVLSYKQPDSSLAEVGMDDYLTEGLLQALDVVQDVTGAPSVNMVSLCLGGTLTAALLAYLTAHGEADRVRSATLLNTLVDFTEPGVLGTFTDETTVARLEKKMERTGYLPGDNMRTTFNMLRPDDLVWGYVVNNWFMGEDPPPFDLLTWNADATRLPARMQSQYLRSCYMHNELAKGEMTLAGTRLDLTAVKNDLYFVAAELDHIAPWRGVYHGATLPAGDVRFVLSNSGHIAGVVNPPKDGGKSRHWVTEGDLPREDPEVWREGADEVADTWWNDWTPWLAERGGKLVAPPPMGNERHTVIVDAPGTYVHEPA